MLRSLKAARSPRLCWRKSSGNGVLLRRITVADSGPKATFHRHRGVKYQAPFSKLSNTHDLRTGGVTLKSGLLLSNAPKPESSAITASLLAKIVWERGIASTNHSRRQWPQSHLSSAPRGEASSTVFQIVKEPWGNAPHSWECWIYPRLAGAGFPGTMIIHALSGKKSLIPQWEA